MAIIATNSGNSIDPVPAGMHLARCIKMFHIGTVKESFEGTEKEMNKIMITWELPNCLYLFEEGEKEEPRMISKEYTLSMNPKSNLRKHLDSWRGTPFSEEEAVSFDVTKLLGVDCMIQVLHSEKTKKDRVYANVNVITPVTEGTSTPSQYYPTFEFNYENIKETFKDVPEWIQKKIKTSKEFADSGFVPSEEPKVETKEPAKKTEGKSKPKF